MGWMRATRNWLAGKRKRLLQKRDAIQRTARLILMLEVDVDVALLGQCKKPHRELGKPRFRVASAATQPEAGVAPRGMHLRGLELLGLGDTERGVVLAQ